MANMSYCRFENTSADLSDCINALEEERVSCERESFYARKMYEQCKRYIRIWEEQNEEEDE